MKLYFHYIDLFTNFKNYKVIVFQFPGKKHHSLKDYIPKEPNSVPASEHLEQHPLQSAIF